MFNTTITNIDEIRGLMICGFLPDQIDIIDENSTQYAFTFPDEENLRLVLHAIRENKLKKFQEFEVFIADRAIEKILWDYCYAECWERDVCLSKDQVIEIIQQLKTTS